MTYTAHKVVKILSIQLLQVVYATWEQNISIVTAVVKFNPFVPDPALKRVKTDWLLRIFKNSYFIARTFRLHTQVPNALEKHLK